MERSPTVHRHLDMDFEKALIWMAGIALLGLVLALAWRLIAG
jgi:hypothetical protein